MDTPEQLKQNVEALQAEVQQNVKALQAEVGQLRSDMSAMATKVKDFAVDIGQETYSKARATAAAAREKAEQASDSASRAIEDRPLISVIAAFVIGVVVGATVLAALPTRHDEGS